MELLAIACSDLQCCASSMSTSRLKQLDEQQQNKQTFTTTKIPCSQTDVNSSTLIADCHSYHTTHNPRYSLILVQRTPLISASCSDATSRRQP